MTDKPAAPVNRDQDPNHPANKTLSPTPTPATTPIPPADMMTEQEKDKSSELHGVGPVTASEVSPGPVETIEDQDIGPRTPYPTGNPPPIEETVTRSQGIHTGKPATNKPGETVKKEPVK